MCPGRQLGVIARLRRCIEQRWQSPSVLQAVITCLIPEHKPGAVKFRGIGLRVSLYRVYGRLRQNVARSWGRSHRLR
eukprot:7195091-Pyramimonas_sp.AAC.1